VTPRKRKTSVVAVVPAFNEEATVARTVKSLLSVKSVGRVVVVADGCSDATVQEATGVGATVLARARRRGKGRALEEALDRIGPTADVYLFVDGDVGDTAIEAGKLVDEVAGGRLDVAIGRLPALEGGGFGLVKRMAAGMIRRVGAFDAEACRPFSAGFGLETAMTMDLVRLGFRVGEVPVDMAHRPTGRGVDGFIHRGRQGLQILAAAVPRLAGIR
jgi:glycosyltransferase involved in cell wall biosynthesis